MEKLRTLLELLAPWNKTSGEYSATISLYPGSEHGMIHFSIDWKNIIGEAEFRSYDEAIEIVQKIKESYNIEDISALNVDRPSPLIMELVFLVIIYLSV